MKKLIIIIITIILLLVGCDNTVVYENNTSSCSVYQENNSQHIITDGEIIISEWSNYLSESPQNYSDIFPDSIDKKDIDKNLLNDIIIPNGDYVMPPITNKTPLSQIISEIEMPVVMSHILAGSILETMGPDSQPQDFKNSTTTLVPITFLRKTSDYSYYTVCKVNNGGLAYFFFERPFNSQTGEYLVKDPTYILMTGCIYTERVFSYDNFTHLKRGDSIQKVVEVDNIASIVEVHNNWNLSIYGSNLTNNASLHLLKDGILTIVYDRLNNDYIIKDIIYNEDFIFNSPFLENAYPKYYGILPQDYPPET